ncbi:MAG: hypothetical protein MZV63_31710 [Marinilabiliales bacterium]|nr:hypothetical protein [Marinilabiliales bacterium]
MAGTRSPAHRGTGEEEQKPPRRLKASKFDASTFIMEHVADSHEWHILYDRKDGSRGGDLSPGDHL